MAVYNHKFGGTTSGGELFLFTWSSETGNGLDQVHSAAEGWADAFWNGDGTTTGYAQEVPDTVTLQQVETVLFEESTGRQLQKRTTGVAYPGRQTGVELPPDVAICLSLRTDNASRSGRGRFFLPQPAASIVRAGGIIAQTTIDNIVASANTAWSAYVSVSVPTVYSPTLRTSIVITSYDVSNHFDTIRGRDNVKAQSRTSQAMP